MISSINKHSPLIIAAPSRMEFTSLQKGIKRSNFPSQVSLACCGVGETQAREFCQTLEDVPIRALVLLGWAGGLKPDIRAGDIVIATQALHNDHQRIECNILDLPKAARGPVLTVPKALLTSAEKTQAQASGALAVEMEAYPLAEWANRHAVQFIHARVILDAFDESLPDVGPGLDASGNVSIFPFLKQFMRQPKMLGDLWRLNQRVRQVDPILEELACQVANRLT